MPPNPPTNAQRETCLQHVQGDHFWYYIIFPFFLCYSVSCLIYNYVISFVYTPFYNTGANILSFEIDPPPKKDLHGRHFVGLTFSNFTKFFFTFSNTISYAYQISSSCNIYIFFSSGVP